MSRAPTAATSAPELPFKYVGGDPAVDLVNTVDWTSHGPAQDRLTDYVRLTRWAEGAGLITARLADAHRAGAIEHPRDASRAFREALELRWTLRQIFAALAHDEAPSSSSLSELNEIVAKAMGRLQLATDRGSSKGALRWTWSGAGDHLDSVLWPVARSAAELLVSDEADRIRECGAAGCGWQYVDRSRNGLRRWCQMEVCGTQEKSRRRALKQRGS